MRLQSIVNASREQVTDMKELTNVTHLVGPFVDEPDVESTLDIQYITAMGLDATNWCGRPCVPTVVRADCLHVRREHSAQLAALPPPRV